MTIRNSIATNTFICRFRIYPASIHTQAINHNDESMINKFGQKYGEKIITGRFFTQCFTIKIQSFKTYLIDEFTYISNNIDYYMPTERSLLKPETNICFIADYEYDSFIKLSKFNKYIFSILAKEFKINQMAVLGDYDQIKFKKII